MGLRISFRHLRQATRRRTPVYVSDDTYFAQKTGVVTLNYPYEAIPMPDHGRYRLHNEMADCIVCDKCAKICPVNCIEIEPIRATGQVGVTSDGSPIRLYAARFDIDMAKCCYCGLCTTVCPTDCLTMTKTYDYSEQNLNNLIYHFANLSPEEAEEKRKLLEQFQREKAQTQNKTRTDAKPAEAKVVKPASGAKPAYRPKTSPSGPKKTPPSPKNGEDSAAQAANSGTDNKDNNDDNPKT
ncbi:MAG: 4Fe-4S dicluster domain-containing protein [Bacteroidia bacterium]|nr:4Fe-4S dicluster domain-containing protein [Bacteroidia bacterium]